MITFLNGVLVEKQPMRVVLDVGGVGYEVFIPLSSYDRLPIVGNNCKLFMFDCVREDQHTLYGFQSEAERRMFLLLISVTGVGPKIALSALSGMLLRELTAAIAGSDIKRLSQISGLGKKKAERIVVELRDKIGEGEALAALTGTGAGLPEEDMKIRDAVLALVSLGYKQYDARTMVKKVLEANRDVVSVEDIVRKALASV